MQETRIPTLKAAATVALVLMLVACGSAPVEHPGDVTRLLADSPAIGQARFAPLSDEEHVNLVPPEREPYRLGIDDVVYVAVPGQAAFIGFGETETGQRVGTPVAEDGNIYLPLVGAVPAEGRTVLEVQEDIRERLSAELTRPVVSVTMLEFKAREFYVLGEVNNPGVFPVDGRVRLIGALAMAGGFRLESADELEAYVVRQGEVLPVSLEAVVRRGDLCGNIPMQDGDLVYVPSIEQRKVYVFGEVRSPGVVSMGGDGRLSLAEALGEARGLDPLNAAEDQIRIFRGGWARPSVYTLSAHEVYRFGEQIQLRPGDRIFVAPTGLATWGRALTQISPILSLGRSGLSTATAVGTLGGD
jgi:polysaccharide export outer membrane protein